MLPVALLALTVAVFFFSINGNISSSSLRSATNKPSNGFN